MIRPTAPEGAACGQGLPVATVSPEAPGGGWVLRLVAAARRNPGLGSHLTIAVLLAIILCICLRIGIVPMRS
jgi:hypothetical protein